MKLLLLFFALFAIQAQAADCVSKEEIQDIASHFTQFNHLVGKDYCYDGSQESHLIAGIMFMRETQFNPMERSKDELFSGRFASSWYNYFIGRINEFEIDEGCPKGVAAYVYGFGGNTMYVCTMMLTDNFTALDRASIFMHEARHIDGFPHVTCHSGPRAGLQGACDSRIADGGSYAVTVETYAQLGRYAKGIHPALKAYAQSSSVIYADEAFDTPVRVNRTQQFLVMANDRSFHKVTSSAKSETLGSAPALGRIVMRAQHMALYPDDTNLKARYLFARNEGEINQEAGQQAADYNASTPAERANLVDTHIAAQWNALVYRDKAVFACDPRAHTSEEVSLGGERPVGILYLDGYDRAAPQAQLMMESGKVYDFGCENTHAFARPSATQLDRVYKSAYKVDGKVFGLTLDGYVREIQGSASVPFSLGALDGQIHEIAPNQSYEFFGE
jgi:hypothetical protein